MQRIVAATCVMLAFAAPDGRVAVTTDSARPYSRGGQVRVGVEVAEPSHLLLVRVDTEGRVGVVLPAQPWDDSAVSGSVTVAFAADERDGIGYLLAIAAAGAFDAAELSASGHWDLRALDGGRVTGDPYTALSRFTGQVARGSYDYDIVPYQVGQRYDYPRFVCYDCHSAAAPDWDAYDRMCTRFGLVVYDDPANQPYRRLGRQAVLPGRPATLAPRYEFRERGISVPAIVNRRRAAAPAAPALPGATPAARPDRGSRERPDSVSTQAPARPRSVGAPELRRRPRGHN